MPTHSARISGWWCWRWEMWRVRSGWRTTLLILPRGQACSASPAWKGVTLSAPSRPCPATVAHRRPAPLHRHAATTKCRPFADKTQVRNPPVLCVNIQPSGHQSTRPVPPERQVVRSGTRCCPRHGGGRRGSRCGRCQLCSAAWQAAGAGPVLKTVECI